MEKVTGSFEQFEVMMVVNEKLIWHLLWKMLCPTESLLEMLNDLFHIDRWTWRHTFCFPTFSFTKALLPVWKAPEKHTEPGETGDFLRGKVSVIHAVFYNTAHTVHELYCLLYNDNKAEQWTLIRSQQNEVSTIRLLFLTSCQLH